MHVTTARPRRLAAGIAGAGLLVATMPSLGVPAHAEELRPGEPGESSSWVPLSAVLAANDVSEDLLGDLLDDDEEVRVPGYCYEIATGAFIVGTAGRDTLVGTDGDDVIIALQGRDVIDGGGGDDLICAGAGKDDVRGGEGDDTVHGQGGRDTLRGGAGDDTLRGQGGRDQVDGGAGDDVIEGGGNRDVLRGGPGDDQIDGLTRRGRGLISRTYDSCFIPNRTGPAGDADQIFGGPGDDRLHGGPGNDCIKGEQGDDRVYAGHGQDRVAGGLGSDRLFGQRGGDTIYSGPRSFIFEKGSPPLFDKAVDELFGGPGLDALYGTAEDTLTQ